MAEDPTDSVPLDPAGEEAIREAIRVGLVENPDDLRPLYRDTVKYLRARTKAREDQGLTGRVLVPALAQVAFLCEESDTLVALAAIDAADAQWVIYDYFHWCLSHDEVAEPRNMTRLKVTPGG